MLIENNNLSWAETGRGSLWNFFGIKQAFCPSGEIFSGDDLIGIFVHVIPDIVINTFFKGPQIALIDDFVVLRVLVYAFDLATLFI